MSRLVPTLTEVGVRMLPAPAEPRYPDAYPGYQEDYDEED